MTSRTVLVTGGTRGIGLACARAFQADGHRVAVTYVSTPPPEDLFGVRCDQAQADQVPAALAAVEAELGPVEVLVANAGTTRDTLLVRMSESDFTDVLDANLTGTWRWARAVVPRMMRARWGRIVALSSVGAYIGPAGQANYAASKAGIIGLVRSIAREYANRGITANVVAPGPIATDMLAAIGEDKQNEMAASVPCGRLGTVEEVAAAVRFLASDEAAYVTGAVLPVDGGAGMGS